MTGRFLVIISSRDRDKVLAALLWALNMKRKSVVEDVKVYFFGPSEELLAGDDEVRFRTRLAIDSGVEVLACRGYAELGGYVGQLEGFLGPNRVTHVGRLIAETVDKGYTPLVF